MSEAGLLEEDAKRIERNTEQASERVHEFVDVWLMQSTLVTAAAVRAYRDLIPDDPKNDVYHVLPSPQLIESDSRRSYPGVESPLSRVGRLVVGYLREGEKLQGETPALAEVLGRLSVREQFGLLHTALQGDKARAIPNITEYSKGKVAVMEDGELLFSPGRVAEVAPLERQRASQNLVRMAAPVRQVPPSRWPRREAAAPPAAPVPPRPQPERREAQPWLTELQLREAIMAAMSPDGRLFTTKAKSEKALVEKVDRELRRYGEGKRGWRRRRRNRDEEKAAAARVLIDRLYTGPNGLPFREDDRQEMVRKTLFDKLPGTDGAFARPGYPKNRWRIGDWYRSIPEIR